MKRSSSLDAAYFDGIFRADDDPWKLATSAYENAKFARTVAVLDDRRYRRGFEVGCAHGVLTRRLAPLCDALLAVDISTAAIEHARRRVADIAGVSLRKIAFPIERPMTAEFDLVVLSEVVYYWSDGDIALAADWLSVALADGGRLLLVHWTGETDYPQAGDEAVAKLWSPLSSWLRIETAERTEDYRLDLWTRK